MGSENLPWGPEIDYGVAGWPRFVPVHLLMRFGFQGRLGSQVRFGSRGSPVRAVRRFTRFRQWPKSSRDTKTEMVTKIVTMRAVNLLTGPFCTEFRCKSFCDDDIFPKMFENLIGLCLFGSADLAVRAGSVRAGSAVRVGSYRFGSCRFGSGGSGSVHGHPVL